ncbi:MAG TPA: hypothetical protein VKZ44_07480 [Taishania sp.]|nr:hypothetical protein [Taishania sp.]
MRLIGTCFLSARGLMMDGKLICQFSDENWLKEAYGMLQVDYPKFYKMDNLSKMAFICTEQLKTTGYFENLSDEEMALIFANSCASQHTDMKFIHSYTEQSNPSPSLFVYTLPNIVTGELAIRNKWYGSNCFYILPTFDANFFVNKLQHLKEEDGNFCLCGWVESKLDATGVIELEESFLFLVSLNEIDKEGSLINQLQETLTDYRNFKI